MKIYFKDFTRTGYMILQVIISTVIAGFISCRNSIPCFHLYGWGAYAGSKMASAIHPSF